MKLKELHEQGYNILALNEDKRPKGGWSHLQSEHGAFPYESKFYGIITGFNNLEVIDVDTKVLPINERESFKKYFLGLLKEHVESFEKITIVETRSGGLHLLYRAKNIQGNLKLAYTKYSPEALIETRGAGGYVCAYEKHIQNDYLSIPEITDEERNTIIALSRSISIQKPVAFNPQIADKKVYVTDLEKGVTPWEDYDQKTDIFDLLKYEFTIVGSNSKTIKVRRNGAKSPYSGYIYRDSGCLYLFSSGTQYPSEQLLSPFFIYTIQNHAGDFRSSAKDLYVQGYGDRHKEKFNIEKPISYKPETINLNSDATKIEFPIDVFPDQLQHYILECNSKLNNSIDYMGCSLLWLTSLCIGNSVHIKVKAGWTEISTLWMALVGKAGIGKTPAIKSIIKPLLNLNGEEIRNYATKQKAVENYNKLSKEDKEITPEPEQPRKTQFIVNDVTIEALIALHTENLNGVGVFKDELAGWFKDMNKYKAGSDKEQWLSSWSGDSIMVTRLSRADNYVTNPILPVLGGIQPDILSTFFTDENKDSGFLDRMLFSFPDLNVEKYNDNELSEELIGQYNNYIVCLKQELNKIIEYDEKGEIIPYMAYWSDEAKKEWKKIFNEITEMQESDEQPEFLKTILPKMKAYIPRFSLIINVLNGFEYEYPFTEIRKENLQKAYKLAMYFIKMNEKMVIENSKTTDMKKIIKDNNKDLSSTIKELINNGMEINKTKLATEFKVSRQTVYNAIKKLQK